MAADELHDRCGKPVHEPFPASTGGQRWSRVADRVYEARHAYGEVVRQAFVEVELPVVAALGFRQATVAGVVGGELDQHRIRGVGLLGVPVQRDPDGLALEAHPGTRATRPEADHVRRVDEAGRADGVRQPGRVYLLDRLGNPYG